MEEAEIRPPKGTKTAKNGRKQDYAKLPVEAKKLNGDVAVQE